MTNKPPILNNEKGRHSFDLEERTLNFSKEVIKYCARLPNNNLSKPLIDQFIRSGTSIGANYAEANEANSKKDFINKIAISKKEAKETQYWIKLIIDLLPNHQDKGRELLKEVCELNLIFAAIIRKSVSKEL